MMNMPIKAKSLFDSKQSTQVCPTHGTPYVMVCGNLVCRECAADFLKKEQKKHEQQLRNDLFNKLVASAMLPARHVESGFKNYIVSNAQQQHVLSQCVEFCKNYINGNRGNIIMTGRTGTGKTHLACAITRNLLNAGRKVRYITSDALATEIASTWKRSDSDEETAVNYFASFDLLILDEYGLHDQHETRLKLVHKVLYARYDQNKPTILISNWNTEQVKENLGDRLWSRFQHDGLINLECNWADARVAV
ncbi:ATP-binding protein [Acinetobacter sp. c3-l95]|uniref:ATP-binding protein n=1 Tax=Acinetobacter sp. c3-l95 TaxID=3342804 RepID=UPI0035B956C1